MGPTVWLREDQAREAMSAMPLGDAASANGVAFGLDEGTVFHVFTRPPVGRAHGELTACRIVRLPSAAALDGAEGQAREFFAASPSEGAEWAWQQGLGVFLALSEDGRVKARAFRASPDGPVPCEVRFFSAGHHLSLRSRGLLETDALAGKHVLIVGLGSGGSTIALELAKAGVGAFTLIDFDRLEPSNVARHACGASDLGRLKIHAVRDAILDRNPLARITGHPLDVTADPGRLRELAGGADLCVGATDTAPSRSLLNSVATALGIPAIFGRAITRAAGGDVLRVRPNHGPCLACVFDQGLMRATDDEQTRFATSRAATPAYVPDAEVHATIQPGLSSDIAPITNLMVKLALVELTRGLDSGLASLQADLQADLYLWANRRERVYQSWAPMAYGFDKPAILRWYGARVARNPACLVCGETSETPIDPFFASAS